MQRRTFCLAAAATGAEIAFGQARAIDDFFREFTDEWVRQSPGLATSQRYFTGAEQDRLERTIAPITPDESRKTIALARKGLAGLKAFNRAGMTDSQRLWADVMEWQLQVVVDEEPYLDYSYPLQQMNGWNVNVVERFTVGRPLTRVRDAENYVAALEQVKPRTEEAIEESKRLAGKGIIPPQFILQATIKQMLGFADANPARNAFVTVFDEKAAAIKELPAARRAQLVNDATKIVASQIYPTWKKAIETLQGQLAKSTNDAGLWRLKGGDEAYAYYLKRFTTTNLNSEQIHQLGLQQVAEIEGQMDKLFRQLGRTEGSVKERVEKLKLDLQYPNPTSEAAREQVMKDFNGFIQDAAKRSEALFDLRPKAPVMAQPFPTFREANAAANYNAPAGDGSRPGIVQFPRRIENMTKFRLRSLAYHEAIPGHHFQIALQVEDKALPKFMQLRVFGGISANSEGWGLYAERLAAEAGWYEGDPEGLLGQLDSALFRARRLVVDTGLHAKRWTREQGIDYGIEASEVERYCVYPGQACSYMIGQLKYVELREKARAALGPKFSVREYHNAVLQTGSVPLNILERQVDAYIAKTRP
jgi:uncharacterized protein (DUF885 family)